MLGKVVLAQVKKLVLPDSVVDIDRLARSRDEQVLKPVVMITKPVELVSQWGVR